MRDTNSISFMDRWLLFGRLYPDDYNSYSGCCTCGKCNRYTVNFDHWSTRKMITEASLKDWIDCKDIPYPQEDNAPPFWVTVEDKCGMRSVNLAVWTDDSGLVYTNRWDGEEYTDKVVDLVTHWMPINAPRYPAK